MSARLLSEFGVQDLQRLTSLLISSCRSGAERAVALIMVDVWLSVSFLMQRWPATMLQTFRAQTDGFKNSEHVTMETQRPDFSHLQGEIGVLLLLPHLQAGQVWILELKVVFLLEVLSHCALHGLPVLQLQREPGRKCACVRKTNPTRPMEHGGAAYV